MKINEIFESIQGEGKYCGVPVLFIRLSGCTRNCKWCDTKYHTEGVDYHVDDVVEAIKRTQACVVVFTGGEPIKQYNELYEVVSHFKTKRNQRPHFHLETNGDLRFNPNIFDYIAFSPKGKDAILNIFNITRKFPVNRFDIKVVTDLQNVNKDLISYATMLMPLSTGVEEKDSQIEKKVWEYCVYNNIRFCLRQHIKVWGEERTK